MTGSENRGNKRGANRFKIHKLLEKQLGVGKSAPLWRGDLKRLCRGDFKGASVHQSLRELLSMKV